MTGVKLELLTKYDLLLMVENGISEGICQATHRYAQAPNKYMKNYDKSIESLYLAFQTQIICMDGQCFKNYPKMVLNGWKSYQNLMKTS